MVLGDYYHKCGYHQLTADYVGSSRRHPSTRNIDDCIHILYLMDTIN